MKDKAIEDAMNSIKNRISHVYNQGYEDGKESVQIDDSTAYERGLNDAWECARKMMLSDEDGGIALSDILKIFGMTQYSAIKSFSASEAMDKIKEYEEKQKRTCDTCQYVGNTLYNLKTYCANCDGRNGWTPKQTEQRCKSKMTIDEAITHCEEVADSKCDECGAEHRQLAEWLKELKRLREQILLTEKQAEHFLRWQKSWNSC